MTLDTRAEDLLYAIREYPDDDAARLVFADHIADRWPAHAAWIVAECSGKETAALRDAFHAELPAQLRNLLTRRGFVQLLRWRFQPRELLSIDADDLFRIAPMIDSIELTTSLGALSELDAVVARLARFHALSITAPIDVRYARALAVHPGLAHLRYLGLSSMNTNDVVAAIAQTSSFTRLERLRLGISGRMHASAIATLGRATFTPTLRTLDVSNNNVDGLASALHLLPGLRELGMGGTTMDAAFAKLPQRFERLWVNSSRVDDNVSKLVADAGIVTRLVELDATGNPWTSQGFVYFLDRCGPLREVVAGEPYWRTGAHVGEALLHHERSLAMLRLYGGLGEDGVPAFASGAFPALRDLTLVEDGLDVSALARAPFLPQLRTLVLSGEAVTAQEARLLAESVGDKTELTMIGALPRDAYELLRARLGSRLSAAGYR